MVFSSSQKPSGFASPAQGYEEQYIDLNRLLVKNRPATYFFRLDSGDMERLGLPMGTLLIVDRSKKPNAGSIVIIRHAGQFYCRLMARHGGKTFFTNKDLTSRDWSDETDNIIPTTNDTEIIGVVTASIKLYDLPY